MYEKLLVPTDGTDASLAGLKEAVKLVTPPGGSIRLLYVVVRPDSTLEYGNDAGPRHAATIAAMCEVGKRILGEAETVARELGLSPDCLMIEANTGSAADAILDHAEEWGANLIVMGYHGGLDGTHVGRDTAKVLAKSSVPVLLVRSSSTLPQKQAVGTQKQASRASVSEPS